MKKYDSSSRVKKTNSTSSIDVWGPKGGIGKTTIAKSMAGAFAADGYKVALIDKDPMRAASAFYQVALAKEKARMEEELEMTLSQRRSIYNRKRRAAEAQGLDFPDFNEEVVKNIHDRVPFVVLDEAPKNGEFDILIYDHPPVFKGNDGLTSNIVVTPTLLDIESFAPILKAYNEMKDTRKIIMVANRVNLRRADQREIYDSYFKDRAYISDRASYNKVYKDGYTIYGTTSYPNVVDTRKEFDDVMQDILSIAAQG
ncbi:ParA family protein [Salmonella enterica]|nr:ParA family protein [Salmonella enterica]EGS8763981.1 ParA family protein [Salmonella enterica subsp. enterica serovar Infantis]HEJ9060794.1 ParA family protein [Serratia fonticola]EBI1134263.1 ParA family protein [Salmonella enterica]ECQ8079917.1 ParA family protein [Salmonella enterica]